MTFIDAHLLSLLVLVPAATAILVLVLGERAPASVDAAAPDAPPGSRARTVALAGCAVALALALRAASLFDPHDAARQLSERVSWIPTLHADYSVGVDGLSILLLILTAVIVPLSLVASWPAGVDKRRTFALVMLLQAGMFGVFTAESFFHWFVFWEMVLIPAFFLIKSGGAAGHDARRAALKFLLYTLVGSVAMLLAFQAIFWATGSMDFIELARLGTAGTLDEKLAAVAAHAHIGWTARTCGAVAFSCIVLACAVKTPLWPFHTWLPDAYGEAPTPATLLLTAGMSKMGVYALLRIALPLFPSSAARLAPVLVGLALVTVVAAAFSALAQTDLKRMMAYSSINHVGLCLLALFAAASASVDITADDRAAALDGAVLQMFVHGIEAALMFFLLAALERRVAARAQAAGDRPPRPSEGGAAVLGLNDFGGLRKVAPWFCGVFGVVTFASIGLPGLAGFVSEILVLRGTFALAPAAAAVALVGVMITAVFLLSVIQRVWWGPLNERFRDMRDLSWRELVPAGVFVLLIVAVGVLPAWFTAQGNGAVEALGALLAQGANVP